MDALAELDERVAVEADVGNVARGRLVEDRLRRRPEGRPLRDQDEALQLGHEIDRRAIVLRRHEVVDEGHRDLPGFDPDLLLAELVDHVVAAVLAGRSGLAVANGRAGEVLELERDVLGDVAHPGPVAEARDEPAAPAQAAGVVLEARQEVHEGLGEARDLVARVVLERAEVDDHPDDGFASPVVGAAQDPRLDDPECRLRAFSGHAAGGCAAARLHGRGGGRLAGCLARRHGWRPTRGAHHGLLLTRLGCGPRHGSLLRSDRGSECTRQPPRAAIGPGTRSRRPPICARDCNSAPARSTARPFRRIQRRCHASTSPGSCTGDLPTPRMPTPRPPRRRRSRGGSASPGGAGGGDRSGSPTAASAGPRC